MDNESRKNELEIKARGKGKRPLNIMECAGPQVHQPDLSICMLEVDQHYTKDIPKCVPITYTMLGS